MSYIDLASIINGDLKEKKIMSRDNFQKDWKIMMYHVNVHMLRDGIYVHFTEQQQIILPQKEYVISSNILLLLLLLLLFSAISQWRWYVHNSLCAATIYILF
jgi:hypothetical protein